MKEQEEVGEQHKEYLYLVAKALHEELGCGMVATVALYNERLSASALAWGGEEPPSNAEAMLIAARDQLNLAIEKVRSDRECTDGRWGTFCPWCYGPNVGQGWDEIGKDVAYRCEDCGSVWHSCDLGSEGEHHG